KEYKFNIIDYFKREEMQVLNAIPTAEGAIQIAMENLPITLLDSKIMVLGFGRIGKALSSLSHRIGADTYVATRNFGDIAWIENLKYNPVLLKDMDDILYKMDVVFNTIPIRTLTED